MNNAPADQPGHRWGEIWFCGDHCNCSQPQIRERGKGPFSIILWEGTWVCEATEEERQFQLEKLIAKANELGAEVYY
jgi:hypothetical protein